MILGMKWKHFNIIENFVRFTHSDSSSPLSGIKVIDLTRIVAGPFCTMTLGDLGAEVYKVEMPGSGDECRRWGPPFINSTPETCYFAAINRNKKSICINIRSVEGRKVIYDLAKKCDVLVENYVPGKLDKYKLGYNDLKQIAPHLIYCSITGYGPEGPYRHRPGYDVIAASVGGFLHITGPMDGEPVKAGVAVTDIATGLYANGAIMAALLKRMRTKKGQKIDCNLLSTQLASLVNIGSNYLNAGVLIITPVAEGPPTLRLKLRKPKNNKKVQWTTGTVDNENMNKKKSKCCCIYEKPRAMDESSSDEDDECQNCHGHVEQRAKSKPEPAEIPTAIDGNKLPNETPPEMCQP